MTLEECKPALQLQRWKIWIILILQSENVPEIEKRRLERCVVHYEFIKGPVYSRVFAVAIFDSKLQF